MDMDDRFSNGAYIEGAMAYPAKWANAAAMFREVADARLDLSYGDSPRQVLDLFMPDAMPKGLCVFVHGGYWMDFDKSTWSHLAAGPVAHGWAVAVPSYDLCPQVRVSDITAQVERAVRFAAGQVAGPIRLTGHSAGGHLVARLAGMAWDGRLAKVVPISAVTDLVPLLETRMNSRLRLDRAEALAESPQRLPAPAVPVTAWVGGDERPVFIEQSQELGVAWNCKVHIEPNQHHFNVIEPLSDPNSPIVSELLS